MGTEELKKCVSTETDAETRFRIRAAQGDAMAGLAVLDKLDKHFESNPQQADFSQLQSMVKQLYGDKKPENVVG